MCRSGRKEGRKKGRWKGGRNRRRERWTQLFRSLCPTPWGRGHGCSRPCRGPRVDPSCRPHRAGRTGAGSLSCRLSLATGKQRLSHEPPHAAPDDSHGAHWTLGFTHRGTDHCFPPFPPRPFPRLLGQRDPSPVLDCAVQAPQLFPTPCQSEQRAPAGDAKGSRQQFPDGVGRARWATAPKGLQPRPHAQPT